VKILITYASTGAGHFKAAEALYNYLKENSPETDLKLVDVLYWTNALFRFFYAGGYSFLIRHVLLLWKLVFWLTDFKSSRNLVRQIVCLINQLNTKGFVRLLTKEQFDYVISCHFLPAEICAYSKRTKKINSRLITVITDFGVHGFWVSKGTDIYVVATESTKSQLVMKGVAQDIIKVFGIPIDARFHQQYDLDVLQKKFNADKNKFKILIVTGSFGIGPIEKIVGLLYRYVQIFVVCAENKRLYKRLKNRNYPNVFIFGFIDYIPELMSISDIIITKPGGMTIAESLAKDLFPIFIMSIPGQETSNIKILSQYGIGLYAKDACLVKDAILDYKNNPDKFELMKQNISKIKKLDSAREICRVVCQCSAGFTC
jgi:processive 1,2-diacylglycerol beta-glucosyltransferase